MGLSSKQFAIYSVTDPSAIAPVLADGLLGNGTAR